MKGIWKCNAIVGGTRQTRRIICRNWNVHNGNHKIPKRIDVRCYRCNTRHQHVPAPRDERGRDSQIRYIRFPDEADLEMLVELCQRRNAACARLGQMFMQASEV